MTNPSWFLPLTHMTLPPPRRIIFHPHPSQMLHFDDADYVTLVWRPAAANPAGKAEWQRRHNQKRRERQRLSRQARQQPQ